MTTTTEHLQTGPEYYSSWEEYNTQKYNRKNSNSRYSSYNQTHFTVGDEDQFEEYRNKFTKRTKSVHEAENNLQLSIYWNKYENIPALAVSNTFRYIFHKFKKGIFIQIRNNQVSVMLPFSKHAYTNEWGNLVDINLHKYNSIDNFFKILYAKDNRKFNPKYINRNINQWYGNNALVRYEYPVRENDSGVHMISDMFKELCKHRKVPDIEFFVNKRDYPLLRKDGTESYDYIFGENTPLVSHNYMHYAPILSMCSTDEHADICIPTWDDWARISHSENKYFPKSSISYNKYNFDMEWNDRIPTAIFRGSSTGFGLTFDDNMRLKIAKMVQDKVVDTDGLVLLDAGITKWNIRPRKEKNSKYIDIFNNDVLSIPTVSYMSIEDQAKYKYIVYIDGHVSAYRLSLQLSTGSVVLIVQSKYKLWYSHLMVPFMHYIPVNADLSDLYTKIKWCKMNDEKCKSIAQNAKLFYDEYLCKNGILNYLEQLLVSTSKMVGDYTYSIPYLEIQREHEEKLIQNIDIPILPDITHVYNSIELPPYRRTFDLLQGIQWFIYKYPHNILIETNDKIICKRETHLKVYTLSNTCKKILSKQVNNYTELIHEAMIGFYCINPLLTYVPNFSYTFGFKNNSLLTEYFENQTLQMYLLSKEFKIQTFIYILIQISLALHTAQQQYLFIHYDLYPWNILLTYSREPVEVVYYTKNNQHVRFNTKIIPVIIDYGKSHCVHNNQHYGFINPFSSSTIHDILCILLSSMYVLLDKRELSKKQLHYIFDLSIFFSGTQYTNGKYFNTTRELKQFVGHNKKFSQMINSKKYELEEKTPLDFVQFLTTKFHINLEYTDQSNWIMRQGTSRHVYDYIIACTDDERYNTYVKVLDRICNYKFDDKYSSIEYKIFSRIITSIKLLCPCISVKTVEKFIKKYKNKFETIDQIHIDIPSTPVCTLDIIDDPDEFQRIYDIYNALPEVPSNVHVLKQLMIDFQLETIPMIDNIKYLQYSANMKLLLN